MATKSTRRGRRRGGRNRGYFYRKGRGWCASDGKRAIPLRTPEGEPLRDRETPIAAIEAAHRRLIVDQERPVKAESETDQATVLQACQLYLDHCKATGAASTYTVRADTLFDFCFGLPASFREGQHSAKEIEKARTRKAYGALRVADLKKLHVDQWLDAHEGWKGCRRTKIQALKRALNYSVEAGFVTTNPIKGYKTAKAGMRRTYLTPEQEQACYENANPALAAAIKVCIRTGARFDCEFTMLTAKHVVMNDRGMEWRFSAKESKTGKVRTLRIPNTEPVAREVIQIVKRQIALYPTGPLFRSLQGLPWTRNWLSQSFRRLRNYLTETGMVFDDDACMYSCRHTYAKRTLNGFWTGKPSTIERLSELMGNSREVCWEHYAGFCESYTDPLWESA